MHLDVEKNLKAAALKGGALGASQVRRPLVQVVLHRELDVLVLPRAHARLRAPDKRAAPMRALVMHFTFHTLLLDASRNSFIRRCDISPLPLAASWARLLFLFCAKKMGKTAASEMGGEAAPALATAAQEAREIMAYLGAISVPPGAKAQLNVSAGE